MLSEAASPCAGWVFSNRILASNFAPKSSPLSLLLCAILMPWRWSSPLTARSADDSYRTLQEDSVVTDHASFVPNYLANYFWIALGAVVGSSARYFLSTLIARNFSSAFP